MLFQYPHLDLIDMETVKKEILKNETSETYMCLASKNILVKLTLQFIPMFFLKK